MIENRNAENVLIIHDEILAKKYLENLNKRKSLSKQLTNTHEVPTHN